MERCPKIILFFPENRVETPAVISYYCYIKEILYFNLAVFKSLTKSPLSRELRMSKRRRRVLDETGCLLRVIWDNPFLQRHSRVVTEFVFLPTHYYCNISAISAFSKPLNWFYFNFRYIILFSSSCMQNGGVMSNRSFSSSIKVI